MPHADRGSHRIFYEAWGPAGAPPLLLIMGMGFSSRAWGRLPERLAGSFRVLAVDNRGTGRSTAPRGRFRVTDMADDAAAVLDAAAAPRAAVFGISMGGMIALELALRFPSRVSALVLGATFGGFRESRKAALPVVWEVVLGGALSRLGRHGLLGRDLVADERVRRDPEGLAAWLTTGERIPTALAARQLGAVWGHAATSRLAELKVPVLVLTGDRDRLVPPGNARQLAEAIPGARLVFLPGAGHCFPLERPEETLREVTGFLAEGEPPASGTAGAAAGAQARLQERKTQF